MAGFEGGEILGGTVEAVYAFSRGDFTADGQVEQADLNLVLNNWGLNLTGNLPAEWVRDFPIGFVDQAELNSVFNNWGGLVASDFRGIAVPEPATLAGAALAAMGLLKRGRERA
ncbi:MAG: PEP-CTERM sorting domain-containing protein [Planctomycetota bacterium]